MARGQIVRTGQFLKEVAKRPSATGALAPSSKWLSQRIIAQVPIADADVIVELGPGTGSFTREICANMKPDARFFAIELNETLVRVLEKRFPHVRVYNDSVANIGALCNQEGISGVDCIISGLPWVNFHEELQTSFLDSVVATMNPGASFTTFAYLHGLVRNRGKAFRRELEARFSSVERTSPVWRNLPPAVCYRCVL